MDELVRENEALRCQVAALEGVEDNAEDTELTPSSSATSPTVFTWSRLEQIHG